MSKLRPLAYLPGKTYQPVQHESYGCDCREAVNGSRQFFSRKHLMSNTTYGEYYVSETTNMLAYDRLPAPLREAHRNAIFDYAIPPDLRALREGETVLSLIEQLIESDVETVRQDAKRDWQDQVAAYLAAQRPRRRRDWLDKPLHSRI